MGSSWSSSSSGYSSGRRHHSSHPYYQYPNPNYYYAPSNGTSSPYPPPPHAPQPLPPLPPLHHFGQRPVPPPHIPPNNSYPGPGWADNGPYNYRPNYPSNGAWWPPQQTSYPVPAPPFVEHQSTVKVKNDVNVHKGSVKLEMDDDHPDRYLVSFVFDAEFDGRITICYMAKEHKVNPNIIPERPEFFEPLTIPFQKGFGQKFLQPSGTGVDLGFFEFDELAKPSRDEAVFPLVILAEVFSTHNQVDSEFTSADVPEGANAKSHFQFTMGVLERKNGGAFQVKVMKQILWIDGVRYELQDLYGIASKSEEGFTNDGLGEECVICMTEPKNTAVLPCRHLCLCEDCAKELRHQTNKCPICRAPITELIEINVN